MRSTRFSRCLGASGGRLADRRPRAGEVDAGVETAQRSRAAAVGHQGQKAPPAGAPQRNRPDRTRALTLLVEQLERAKYAATSRPRKGSGSKPGSRHLPASVRREVWKRDQGRCAFVGTRGRCAARGFLEFHHVEPYAAGGSAEASNIQLRCRAHNVYEADLFFGASLAREERVGW